MNGYNCGRVLAPCVREFRPDVIIGYFLYPLVFAALAAARELKLPVIAGPLGSDLRGISSFMRLAVARTMRNASFVVTVSEELRKCAMDWAFRPERSERFAMAAIPPSSIRRIAPPPALPLNIDSAVELVVFAGRLVPTKGLRDLLQPPRFWRYRVRACVSFVSEKA